MTSFDHEMRTLVRIMNDISGTLKKIEKHLAPKPNELNRRIEEHRLLEGQDENNE